VPRSRVQEGQVCQDDRAGPALRQRAAQATQGLARPGPARRGREIDAVPTIDAPEIGVATNGAKQIATGREIFAIGAT
jgi:hypothetical protein